LGAHRSSSDLSVILSALGAGTAHGATDLGRRLGFGYGLSPGPLPEVEVGLIGKDLSRGKIESQHR